MEFSDEYKKRFQEKNFKIFLIPEKYHIKHLKRNQREIKFSLPESLYEYLNKEKLFWEQHKEHPFFITYFNNYNQALSDLKNSTYLSNFNHYITQIMNTIKNIPSSDSVLTKELLKHKKHGKSFYEGFLFGISNQENSISSINKEYLLGVYNSFQYVEIIRKIDDLLPEQQESFTETQSNFKNVADEYIVKYNELFQEKEKQFNELDKKIINELEEQKKSSEMFIKEKENRINELEKLYNEKLRLEAPAQYWGTMTKEYSKKAYLAIGIAALLSVLSIIGLILLIVKVPQVTQTSHWFDLVKNTAILTVITSILIYSIRITIKMAMSSLHLARDAKEREQLTYFYLSLINEKAVTDKERELVITSLFSRSDTGLLKGDSSPEMPSINISDFLNKGNR